VRIGAVIGCAAPSANSSRSKRARAFGARGLTVDSLDALGALPGMIQTGAGLPLVVDVKIDRDIRHPDLA